MMPCLRVNDLFLIVSTIIMDEHSINPERIRRLLDAREFKVE